MGAVSIKTRIADAALKITPPAAAKAPVPDLSFLNKPIWEMSNAEVYARCEIEHLAARMAELLFKFTDETTVSDTAIARQILCLQWEIRNIVEKANRLEGELEDENGIAYPSHER